MHPSSSRVIPKRAEQERAKQVEFEFGAYTTESHHWCGEMIMCVVVAPSLSASAVPENVKKWAVNHNEERSCLLALQPQQVAAPEAVGRQWPVVFGNMISLQWEPREKGVWREEGSKLSGWFLLGFFFSIGPESCCLPILSSWLRGKWTDFPSGAGPVAAQLCWVSMGEGRMG